VFHPFEILDGFHQPTKPHGPAIHANRVQIARKSLKLRDVALALLLTLARAVDFFYIVYEMSADTPVRPPGEFERAVLLAVLRLGAAAYGVSIRAELEQRLSRTVSLGSVYTTLDRLLAKGLVTASHGEPTPERGGRAKKFFTIEARGVAALEHARRTADAVWAIDPVVRTS
jgi:PadR family transcriptional regulator PadR